MVSEDNSIYTEKEKLQSTLNLFVNNNLLPIFDDKNITELYEKIYFEKPKLLEQLAEIQLYIDEKDEIKIEKKGNNKKEKN